MRCDAMQWDTTNNNDEIIGWEREIRGGQMLLLLRYGREKAKEGGVCMWFGGGTGGRKGDLWPGLEARRGNKARAQAKFSGVGRERRKAASPVEARELELFFFLSRGR